MARGGVPKGFLPVAAPSSVIPDRRNEHYATEEDMLDAIADAMRDEYQAIVDAGLTAAARRCAPAVTYDRMVPPASLADYRRWVELQVRAINHASQGIPDDRIRYHVCWGSWPGPHTTDVPLQGHRRPRCCACARAPI